jgi:cell division FtsZ-interacting protein ZapD
MRRVQVGIRVTLGQEVLLKKWAAANSITSYQAATRVFERGLSEVLAVDPKDAVRADLASQGEQLDALIATVVRLEGLIDRTLYVAAAAYAYARQSALKADHQASVTDERLATEAQQAFSRQRRQALEQVAKGGAHA